MKKAAKIWFHSKLGTLLEYLERIGGLCKDLGFILEFLNCFCIDKSMDSVHGS
jgi:hypothetical protein